MSSEEKKGDKVESPEVPKGVPPPPPAIQNSRVRRRSPKRL